MRRGAGLCLCLASLPAFAGGFPLCHWLFQAVLCCTKALYNQSLSPLLFHGNICNPAQRMGKRAGKWQRQFIDYRYLLWPPRRPPGTTQTGAVPAGGAMRGQNVDLPLSLSGPASGDGAWPAPPGIPVVADAGDMLAATWAGAPTHRLHPADASPRGATGTWPASASGAGSPSPAKPAGKPPSSRRDRRSSANHRARPRSGHGRS